LTLPTDPVFWAVAALAVIIVGLGKGGFAGLGSAAMPLMALVIDPISAAAILLPLFIVQDAVGVWAFRKEYDARTLGWALPGALVGTFLGWLLAASVAVWVVEAAVGAIALAFGINRIAAMRGHGVQASGQQSEYMGLFWGGVSGFTSQIALAGGPPFQIWAMSRHLTHHVFVGTCAIFFATINWFKVPAFLALGQFTPHNLALSAMLLPVAIASTFAGVALVRRVSAERFLFAINLLMIAVGTKLLWNGLMAA
jgi:uncharacterized membrane protein YfcA